MKIEKIIIDGKGYVPQKECKYNSCLGCDLYRGRCMINKGCRLFGNGIILKRAGFSTPTLTDYTTIKSYEDACIALCVDPIYSFTSSNESHVALIQLETIAEAIRGKDGPVQINSNGGDYYFFPYFEHYKEREIKYLTDGCKNTGLWINAINNSMEVLALANVTEYVSSGYRQLNPRLAQLSYEKAEYFGGRNFIQLWATYFGLTFDKDNFYIKQ
jgi:hypothetical protein